HQAGVIDVRIAQAERAGLAVLARHLEGQRVETVTQTQVGAPVRRAAHVHRTVVCGNRVVDERQAVQLDGVHDDRVRPGRWPRVDHELEPVEPQARAGRL